MVNSIIPIIQGIEYQARYFWLQVCRLFHDDSEVAEVGFEVNEVKSFDDVVVYKKPKQDEPNTPCEVEYYQVKFHVDYSNAFTCKNLMDPAFIGAKTDSFLKKLHNAVKKHGAQNQTVRFYIVSNWQISHDDLLGELIGGTTGGIRPDRLMGGGPDSRYGKVRSEWKKHLDIFSDDELIKILSHLRFRSSFHTLDDIQQQLNENLRFAGLAPVADGGLINPYDDLISKLIQAGENKFDRIRMQNICEQAGLWVGHTAIPTPAPTKIGARSRMRYAEDMEHETESMLCLTKYFNDRQIHAYELWHDKVFPELQEFLTQTIKRGGTYHLRLDTHCSIAFAAGYCLGLKSGAEISIRQPTPSGIALWKAGYNDNVTHYPGWDISETSRPSGGHDVAVAISIAKPTKGDVEQYVNTSLPDVRRIINFAIASGANNNTVRDGTHSFSLATAISTWLKTNLTLNERSSCVHVFISAPNTFAFHLGQLAPSLGRCVLYEYGFESNLPGAYTPSLRFPPTPA